MTQIRTASVTFDSNGIMNEKVYHFAFELGGKLSPNG